MPSNNLAVVVSVLFVGVLFAMIMRRFWKRLVKSDSSSGIKQGAYGAVPIHKHSLLKQLAYPQECFAMVRVLCNKYALPAKSSPTLLSKEIWTHLDRTSRSFAAVIRVLPSPDVSDSVCIFYLLLRALDTIEDEMQLDKFQVFCGNETPLEAKVRLLNTFHTLLMDDNSPFPLETLLQSNVGAHAERELIDSIPLLISSFREKIQGKQVIANIVRDMGKGMSEFCLRDMKLGTRDQADYDQYCHIVAGLVGKGLSELFVSLGYENADLDKFELWNSMGLLLQRTNITRDVCEDAAENRSWWPQTVWTKYESHNLSELRDIRALNEMVCDALTLVPQALEYLNRVKTPGIYQFCALPQVMAIATLNECYNNPLVYSGVVKIRTGQAAKIMLSLQSGGGSLAQSKQACQDLCGELLLDVYRKAEKIDDRATMETCEQSLQALEQHKSTERMLTSHYVSNTSVFATYFLVLSSSYAWHAYFRHGRN